MWEGGGGGIYGGGDTTGGEAAAGGVALIRRSFRTFDIKKIRNNSAIPELVCYQSALVWEAASCLA